MKVWNYYNLRWLSGYSFVSDAPNDINLIIEKLAAVVDTEKGVPAVEIAFDGNRYFCVLKSLVYVEWESRNANYVHAFVVDNGLKQDLDYRKLGSVFLQVYGEDIQKIIEEIYSSLSREEKSDKGRHILRKFSVDERNILQVREVSGSIEFIFRDFSARATKIDRTGEPVVPKDLKKANKGRMGKNTSHPNESQPEMSSAEEVLRISALVQEVECLKQEIYLLKESGGPQNSLTESVENKGRRNLLSVYVLSIILLVFISAVSAFLLGSMYGSRISSSVSPALSDSSSEEPQEPNSTADCFSGKSGETGEELKVASRISDQELVYRVDIQQKLCPNASSMVRFTWDSPIEGLLTANIADFAGGGWGEILINVGYTSETGGSILLHNPGLRSKELKFSVNLVAKVSRY